MRRAHQCGDRQAPSGTPSVSSLCLQIGVAVEGDGSGVNGQAFRIELPLRGDDAVKMAIAVDAPHQHRRRPHRADRAHARCNIIQPQPNAAMTGTIVAGAVRTKPVMDGE